uniref:arginine kinase n=1 Tax=Romanomermis culicivorax TaxID=13658 RepID=A0A915HUL1_ROMCU
MLYVGQFFLGSTSSAASKSVGSKSMGTVIAKIEDGYAILQRATDCKSLLKKHLTKEVLDTLKTKNTSFGSTLWDVIQSGKINEEQSVLRKFLVSFRHHEFTAFFPGVKNLDSGVGVYAPDAEAYRTFIDLFDPILAEYHGFTREQKQPPVDLGEGKIHEFVDLDPENKFIVSTRIRCGRSIQGYPFNPCLTEENYKEMEQKMISLFGGIKDPDLQGTYYPLTGMTKEVQNELIKDHFLFKEGDRFLREANACRFWPAGRGIFLNQKKTFLVWVNEEDHLRIISMQPGGHAGQVLDRLIKGLKTIEAQMPFSRDERFGWLTFCPTNLGTTIRASVHIKVPKISKQPDFKTICDSMKLQIRGT